MRNYKAKNKPTLSSRTGWKVINKIVHFRATALKECFPINTHMKKYSSRYGIEPSFRV